MPDQPPDPIHYDMRIPPEPKHKDEQHEGAKKHGDKIDTGNDTSQPGAQPHPEGEPENKGG